MAPPKKPLEWIDSENRFMARVSPHQDCVALVRLELRVPGGRHSCTEMAEDNLFLGLQEAVCLRPYLPANVAFSRNPDLCEVNVHVDNFWSTNESGGNSGHLIRRGTVDVSGGVNALKRLRGETDKRFTRAGGAGAAGVRGLKHILENGKRSGLHLNRMRTAELAASPTFTGSRWLCVDYSATHPFHCKSVPCCSFRNGDVAAYTNPNCKQRRLYLQRDRGNAHDPNAVAVVVQSGAGFPVVGFMARELAACVAAAMDSGVVEVAGPGLYSKTDLHSYRIWFKFNATVSRDDAVGVGSDLIQADLKAIPWWSEEDLAVASEEDLGV